MFSYPTPFTPPTTEEDGLSWLRLIRSRRVGPSTFWRLLSEHGSSDAALAALPAIAAQAGVEGYTPFGRDEAAAELARARAFGARLLCAGTAAYPASLSRAPEPPPVLWVKGRAELLARPSIALAGARNASSLGLRMARAIAADLGAAGHVVVSGLARGVDAAAHRAALPTGTIAVLAGGLDVVYPAENAELQASIAQDGLLLSEQPFGLQPLARHFPQRNRLIAGLAAAVVVVEAAPQSGSLITARLALDIGREVMAVPGHPFDGRAGGCNALIRDGAVLVRGARDILEGLAPARDSGAPERSAPEAGPSVPPAPPEPPAAPPHKAGANAVADEPAAPKRTLAETAALHRQILERLGPSPVAEDQLIRDLSVSAARLGEELVALELEGRVARQPGGLLTTA